MAPTAAIYLKVLLGFKAQDDLASVMFIPFPEGLVSKKTKMTLSDKPLLIFFTSDLNTEFSLHLGKMLKDLTAIPMDCVCTGFPTFEKVFVE